MKHGGKIALAAAALAATAAAVASETITYTYDARGRLVKVESSRFKCLRPTLMEMRLRRLDMGSILKALRTM